MTIQQHVLKYPVGIRIQILAVLLVHQEQLERYAQKYPTQIVVDGYSAVIDSFSDRTLDGWANAIWGSL
jgi:hypothetical protein